jgi:hypothetical protein
VLTLLSHTEQCSQSRSSLPLLGNGLKSKSRYDRRSVGEHILVSNNHMGPTSEFCYCQTVGGLLSWSALSDERMGLSFTIAAHPRQRSHSRVRVPRDSRPYFTVSDSRLPQPGGPAPRIYIPQEDGGPVIHPSIGSPFRCLLTRRAKLRHSNTPPSGDRSATGPSL